MESLKDKVLLYLKKNEAAVVDFTMSLRRPLLVVFIAYLLASIASTLSIAFLTGPAIETVKYPRLSTSVDIRKDLNYRQVRKDVVRRNIFNSDGELPDETEAKSEVVSKSTDFDASSACGKSTLPLELMGIIYSTRQQSAIASVREKGFSIADNYRAGDSILGHEQAIVYAVQPRRLVINNSGNKECLEIKAKKGRSYSSSNPNQPVEVNKDEQATDELATVQLQSSFVEDALGPGFSKILKSGRLVPYNKDGAMIGFKLIGVKGGSLWKKAGLNSGDVITSVNGISMAQPDKGFAFYEALQNEREIRVDLLKKGKDPRNISIEIK